MRIRRDDTERLLHGVRVAREGGVERWTIDREAARNAFDRGTMESLGQLAERADADPEVRAVVITGAGQKAFCAGADLKERKDLTLEQTRGLLDLYRLTADRIDRLSKPVIAAINGVAFGGGLELALACDLRVADTHAVVGLTEVSLGIIPGAGGTQRLTRVVGAAKAKELILFARRMSAAEALALGVVHRVADGESALTVAMRMAAELAASAPIALAAALEAVDGALDGTLEQGLDLERRCYERALASEDRNEALRAFAEKRAPRFQGR
ncbi:MAG: enoyl-CoA hydratase/isomerase family protein [Sandaracinaceae bacterium]|nr:enoyl-CoA hydratase/isomerase family protein [Myxococcales bacterium]MCB9658844.1 enoyl-CoA hydratase/isomerase family protein [Sandaracinaceae bacterium]